MEKFMEAWKVSENEFPHSGSPEEILSFCIRYAILAPSTYNTQPWFFNVHGNTLSLYADRRFGLPVIDPDDRQLSIACAAALFNIKLTLKHFGYNATTELVPDPSDEDCLARVKLGDKLEKSDKDDGALFQAIAKRHIHHGVFESREVPEDVLRSLKSAAAEEGAWLHICDPIERRIVVRLISEGDHIQVADKNFRRELAGWVNPRRAESGDGLPGYGQSFSEVMNSLSPYVFRRFEGEAGQPVNDQQLENGSPVLAILGSKSGGLVERIHAGQAYMRILLQAQTAGLSVSTLNQPCEVPELRLRMHDDLNLHGRAQLVMRIGYAGKSQPMFTPRRPISSVLSKGEAKPVHVPANDKQESTGIFGAFRRMFEK